VGLGDQFETVVAAAREGEAWALTALYRDLHPRLLAFLSSREPFEAEDLAAEVWIEAASGLRRFRGGEENFRRWLFTIARRRVIDLRRSAVRRKTHSTPVEALASRPAAGGPETESLESEGEAAALRLINTLPPDQAEVVLLRVVAGLSVADVSKVMGRQPGTVRVLQHRALKRLAQKITGQGETF
jgi:RNA polymerase sigma-70 factor (ECF subfamily)